MSLHFNTFQSYMAMLSQLLHIGQAAAHANATGEDPHGANEKLAAHLDSFAATVDTVGAIAVAGRAAQEAAKNPPIVG